MVNRELIMKRRIEQEALRTEKEKTIKEKVKTFDLEVFKQNVETRTLENLQFTNDTLVKRRKNVTPGKTGAVSFIYSPKNGKRTKIAKDVYIKLDEPSTLQCGYIGDYFYLSEKLKEGEMDYPVRFSQNSPVIYSAKIVEDAIINFNLEYEDGCVCKTFCDVEYFINESTNKMVAKIRISEDTNNADTEGGDLDEA